MTAPATFRYHRPQRGPWFQFFSLRGFEWNRVELAIADLPAELAGVRILHISDLHLRHHWPAGFDDLITRFHARRPDLLLFTGDFVDDKHDHRPALPLVHRLLRSLTPR